LAASNIGNRAAVVDGLKRALDRAGLRSTRRAALIVPDSVARVTLLSFDQLPDKPADLDQLVRWQLKKAAPFPIDEGVVSHSVVQKTGAAGSVAAMVARRDVIAEYEGIAAAAGIHAGIVDLSSLNIMNTVIAAGAASAADWLLVSLAAEATSVAIARGSSLLFYRHRTSVDEEPLSSIVHQTAMYHEDRLGGAKFSQVWLSGADSVEGGGDRVAKDLADQLGVAVETVDVRRAASLRTSAGDAHVLDALAAPVGVLLRERRVA
jgi:Tfp pilus assembly PilM family ATPase